MNKPAMPDWDDGKWSGDPLPSSIRDRHPQLIHIAAVPLVSPMLTWHVVTHQQSKIVGWLEEAGRCATVGDLLDLTDEAILAWPQIGVGKLDQIDLWLSDLADDVINILSRHAGLGEDQVPSVDPRLELVARWGVFAGGATTWGEAEPYLGEDAVPDDVARALSSLRADTLPPVTQVLDADATLEDWVASIDERERAILRGRLVQAPARTLDAIGQEHGVTRERIRQLERRLKDKVPDLLAQEAWRSVRWEVFAVQRRFGAYAPLNDDEIDYLSSAEGFARSLVVWLAGYDRTGDRVQARGFSLPRVEDVPTLPDLPVVDEDALHADLTAAGVLPGLLDWAVDSIKGLGRVDGRSVLWPKNIVEKSYAVLAVRDKQMTPEELAEAIGGGVSVRGLRWRLYDDPRLCRVTRSHIGLVAWGGEAYTSVVDLMCNRIEAGPQPLANLAVDLAADFGVSESSVMLYSAAPVFYVADGILSLRTDEHPFVPRATPQAVSTLYRVGADELVWSVDVDHDLLRGSGRALASEVATFLGMEPGVRITLRNEARDVPVSWLMTSHTGPNIGSLKPQVDAAGAREGDVVRVTVDRAEHSLSVWLRPATPEDETVAARLAWETGVPAYVGAAPDALAAAAHTTPAELVEVLRHRGEDTAADLVLEILGSDR